MPRSGCPALHGVNPNETKKLDEQNQKPCTKTKKVIDRGKRSKTLSEVKPVENISKNLQSFLEISLVNCETMRKSTRILSA